MGDKLWFLIPEMVMFAGVAVLFILFALLADSGQPFVYQGY